MSRLLLLLTLAPLSACADGCTSRSDLGRLEVAEQHAADSLFARLIERLSEPGGYFDTDNLISNETSYLHPLGALERLGVRGGAYIGVGPDQNFSYIAAIRPEIAFIIDIRRDNLLQQLMLKSLFELARNRLEYLCLLHGRPVPDDAEAWDGRSVEDLVDYIDRTPIDSGVADAALAAVAERASGLGYPLSQADVETIRRFHGTFIRESLSLRFRSHGRRPRAYYPTYRQLTLEKDLSGRQASYLAREADFQFLKSLQERDLIVPVVGDLAGEHALIAIGDYLRERGAPVSAFYTSNVEDYVMRAGVFERYARNVARLPYTDSSVVIRSFFGRNFGYAHPQAVSGYYSVQLLQTIESLVADEAAGGYRSYIDLVTRHFIDLR